MVSIKFKHGDDKIDCHDYPIEILKLSSVLRDSMEFADDGIITLTEDYKVMKYILESMQAVYGGPSVWMPSTLAREIVGDFIALADKYDVTGIVHSAQSLAIVKTVKDGRQHDDDYFDCLIYAFRSRDTWLCQHVVRHLMLDDPARWDWNSVELLGPKAWHGLVKAYPRHANMGLREMWDWTANRIDLKTLF